MRKRGKIIHQYKLNGYNIILDTYSGSVHVVDNVAYDIISMYKSSDTEQITKSILKKYTDVTVEDVIDCIDDVVLLEKENKLFSKDPYKNISINLKSKKDEVKALCLHVAHTCNLNCEYCFASQGNYKGKRALMSYDTGKRAIDFLIENSGKRRNLEVDFFGGEPLMNWEVCKELVMYARSIEKSFNKNFRFTLTTNGMLIDDDVIDFTNEQIDNVVLSLDGR